MLRLSLQTGARWVDLGHGVRIQVEPVNTAVMQAARRDPAFAAIVKALPRESLTPGEDPEAAAARLMDSDTGDDIGIALAKAVARRIIRAWEGVADEAGEPAPVTAEAVDVFLDIAPIFERFQRLILQPALVLESEKKGSAPSLPGTSAGATDIAKRARASAKPARRK